MKATFGPAGSRIEAGDFLNSSLNSVTPGYFESMGMRMLAGQDHSSARTRGTSAGIVRHHPGFVRLGRAAIWIHRDLFEVSAWDPIGIAGVLAAVGVVAAIAVAPAIYRAVRIDPVFALRSD